MASLVTKEVEALRAVTDGQNLNSEQVGYLTRLANTEFGRDVFLGGQSGEPRFVEEARKNPQPAPEPVPQQSVAQQEAATAPLPPSALATMPAGMVRVPSFFSPRAAPVSFDDDIDINNLPDNLSSDQLRQALNQKAGDPAFELTESQNITRMRLNKKAGDEIDRAFIAANQAIPGLASLIGGAAKEWFLTTTGQPLGAAIADYVVTRMRAQDMRKQGPKSEADAAALEVQAQNQIAEYGDARLREAATLGESVRKSYINTRSLWNWARQFNDGMMSEGRKRDMLRENLTARGILRNPEQELLSPDQRRSMQMENEVILQREWEARKAGETEDPALDAASEDEEYRRQHAAYVQNKALDRANLGIARFNRGGQEVEERADIRFADPVRFPSPFTDRLITPMENTATLGSIALDPLNAAGGVLGATTKWRLIHRTASVLGKPLTGIEKGAAGIRAAMEARREARIIGLAGRLGMKVDDARFAYDRSTRGLLNVATGGGVAGFGLGYLMSKDENFNQMGDALMVGGAILPALRGAGFVIRNTPKVAGVGGIIMQEAKAGPMGDISRIARNSTNHAEVIRAARPASAQELLQSGVVPPQYARHLRTYTDRAGNLNMAGGAARGADSTLKRVAQNPSNPENVRRFARLADQAGATGLVRALDDVASGTVAAGIGIAPLVAIAPEPEQAGSMIGGALAFGGAGGFIGGRASRAAEAFDIDVARTMVDLNAQGADVGTLFSLPRKSLEKIVNIQATAANKGVDLVLLRDEDYRATLPDVSQGTHMQRAGNVKHTVQEGDTLDALARRYYGTGEAWSQIVAANEGKIVENGGLPVGVELDMPGDNRWRMFVNMGHYSLEGGTVRVAKQADGTTRVSVMKDDGTSAYDFQTPNPEGLRVKDGQKVSAYEPLTNKIDRSLTAMHEFGHEVMRSDMFDGDHRIELRAIVQQIYGADGVQVRKRDYAARLVDREIESGVSEGVEFEFANEQERRDVRDGRVTIAQLRRQRGQQVKSRQELIDEKVAELEQDSVDRTGSPDAWIQDEIVNETLASEVNALELSRIRRGDNPEFFSARVGEAINTMTGRLLEFFGVKLNRSTGKPLDIPSTIFRENPLMKDPVLRKRLLEYVRDYDRYLVGLEDAGSANAKGARMAKSDRAEDFGNSPLVTLHPDPKTGRMENAFLFRGEDGKFYFKEQGDIDAAYKLQREQIRNMVRAQGSRKVPVGSGVFGVRTDDAGRTFVGGAKLPNEFDSMIHVPEHLRKFARALEEGATTGKSWIIQNHFVGSSDSGSYKLSRVRAGGRTIPREAVFINWKVTGADNILGVFLDLDAFRAATMKAINNNELPVFNNDISVVQQKLLQLMDNHRNGRSGAAGLDASPDVAIEMKNTLNGLIGTGTAVQRSTDAFTSLNPRGSIRTYRLDRIDSVKPTGRTGLHADYDKINQNRMPDAEPVDGPNNNRMPSALPQSGMAMPEVPANLSTDQILRELEENQGYLGLSTLGMREGRPVKGGAQQTRELLKRNTALNEELRRRGGPQEESDVERVLRQRGQAMPDAVSTERVTSYHLTDDPNFSLNKAKRPQNNTTLGGDWPNAGIFVGPSAEAWFNGYDYVRPFVVELSHPPIKDMGSKAMDTAGYGGEQFIPAEAFDSVKVERVIPYDEYAREQFGEYGPIESYNEIDAQGKTLPQITGSFGGRDTAPLKNYRYTGKDVRNMSPAQQRALAKRTEKYARGERPQLFADEQPTTGRTRGQAMPDVAPTLENFDAAQQATGGTLRPIADQPENAPIAGRLTPEQAASIDELQEYYRKVTPQRIKELRNDAIDSLASRLINKGIPVAEARGLATETYKKIKSRVAGASQVISGMGTSDLSRMAGTGRPAVPTRKGVNPNWLTSAFEAFESDNDLALMKAQQVAKQLNKKQQAEVSAGKSVDAARASKVRVSTVDLGMQFLIGEGTADKKAFGSSLREDPAAPPRVYASVVEGQKFGSQGNYAVFFEWKKSSPIVATSHHHYGVGNGLTDIHASANIGDKNARSFGNPEAETYDTLPSGRKVLNTRLLVGNAGLDDIRTHQLLVSIPETALSGVRAMYKKGGFSSVKSQLNDIAVRSLVGTKSQGKTKALTSKDGIPVMVAVQKNRTEAYVLNPDLRNVESITIVENKNKEKDTALIKKNLAAAFKNNGSPLPRIKVVSAESGPSGNPGRKKITDEFFNLTGKVVYGAALGGAAALAADESQQ